MYIVHLSLPRNQYRSSTFQNLSAASGQLSISSELGNGTTVKIAIPRASSPKWLCSEVGVHSGSRIVVIDDDPSILELWKGKLSGIESHFYTSVHELDTGQQNSKKDIFLVDYDLGTGLASGLEFIKNSNFEKRSVLVTSQYDSKEIQNEAIKLGLKILPKNRISAISIKNFSEGNDWDLVLIDDDDLVHDAWNFEAKRSKRKLKTFFNLEQFRQFTVNKTVPIFVDYQLESIDGISVANELHVLGFENIYLATGQPVDSVSNLPAFVKSFLGKEFPSHVL